MALILDINYSTLNDGGDCETVVLEDGTGEYDAGTNPNGYQAEAGDASGHPKRSELALYFLLTRKQPEATDFDVDYTNVESEADTVTSWSIPITSDGWYRGQMLAIPIYDATVPTYAVNQVVWYNDALYKCIITASTAESPDSAPAKWEIYTSDIEGLRELYDNITTYSPTSTIYSQYLDFLQYCFGDRVYADAWKDVSDDKPSYYNADLAFKITAFLEGAKIAAARGNYREADRKITKVQDLGDNPNCKSC